MADLASFVASLIGAGPVTQTFGQNGVGGVEQGTDVALPAGQSVLSQIAGTITSIGPWGTGKLVTITPQQGQGETVAIGHIDPLVAPGQQVTPGTPLGIVDSTINQYSSGPHIEVQVRQNGQLVNPQTYASGAKTTGISAVTAQLGNVAGSVVNTVQAAASNLPDPAQWIQSLVEVLFGGALRFLFTVLGVIALFIGGYILFGNPSQDASKIAKVMEIGAL